MPALVIAILLFFCAPLQAAQPKVVLLLEHKEASPFNESLIHGLETAARDFTLEVETRYAPKDSDQTAIFREACLPGNLVLVATDNLHEILRDNAANFRKVMFGAIDADIKAANIMSVTFADEQAAFMAGVAAAMFDPAKPLAWLSGSDTPAIRSLYNGFVEGAKLVNPDVRIAQAVMDSFVGDPVPKAETLLKGGPGVIALAAGANTPQAQKTASAAWQIVFDRAQTGDHIFGAIIKKLDRAVYEIAASAAKGQFGAKEIKVFNLENGGVDFILSSQVKNPDIKRRIGEIRQEIIKGAIRIKSLRQRTLCDCLD